MLRIDWIFILFIQNFFNALDIVIFYLNVSTLQFPCLYHYVRTYRYVHRTHGVYMCITISSSAGSARHQTQDIFFSAIRINLRHTVGGIKTEREKICGADRWTLGPPHLLRQVCCQLILEN
jgi:hypothetical protein